MWKGAGVCAGWAMVCAAMLLAGIFQGAAYCCRAMSDLQRVVLTTVHVYVCLWLLRSISLTVSAKGVLLACPALDWQQFGVLFGSSVVALSQELQMLVVLDYPSAWNFHTEKEKL